MAGETIRTRAVCLAIRPWSRTSHVTAWLTPAGVVTTVVKGAVRPKSAFLGQYDLNYTCEILYYARAKGELHALRECSPLERRDALRGDFRALALADWFRRLALDLAPTGPEAAAWMGLVEKGLGGLGSLGGFGREVKVRGEGEGEEKVKVEGQGQQRNDKPSTVHLFSSPSPTTYLQHLLDYELAVLRLAGLAPEFDDEGGVFHLRGERQIPISAEVMACLGAPLAEKNPKILVDTARAIGVYYAFHLDCAPDVRRTVLRMISQ